MQEFVRIATASVHALPGTIADNLAKIETIALRAATLNAQLLALPELSLTGFVPNHPVGDHQQWLRTALRGVRNLAISLDGPAIAELVDLCQRTGLLISTGMFEDAGNRLFNTQVLAGPGGLLGATRKMHVPMFEMPFYSPGDSPKVIDTPLGRIGVNTCFDALMPESTRLLALQNAEIVLFPFAADPSPGTMEAWQSWAAPALQCRCQENGVFGVACNYEGRVAFAGVTQEFPGGSLAFDPRGGRVERSPLAVEAPLVTVYDLHRETLQQARSEPEYLFRFRRPELYEPLTR